MDDFPKLVPFENHSFKSFISRHPCSKRMSSQPLLTVYYPSLIVTNNFAPSVREVVIVVLMVYYNKFLQKFLKLLLQECNYLSNKNLKYNSFHL